MEISQQNIENDIKELLNKSKNLSFMSREEIFVFMADIAFISNQLASDIRAVDKAIINLERNIKVREGSKGYTDAHLARMAKKEGAELLADKEWSKTQLGLLNNLRISALSAQKTLWTY